MPEKYKIQSKSVSFNGHSGGWLKGTLDFPLEVEPFQYAIMSHCFTCTRQTLTASRLSRGLAQAGIASLRFDFTGLGESEGSFADTNFSSMIADIECAAEFLADNYQSPHLLLGHSMGGTASLAASQTKSLGLLHVRKLVTLASPAYPAHVLHHFGAAMGLLEQGLDAEIMVAGQAYPVKPGFIEDVRSFDMSKWMKGCDLPVLAIRAGSDSLIGPQAAEQIMALTQSESRLLQIDGADHLFSNRNHAEQLLSEVVRWVA